MGGCVGTLALLSLLQWGHVVAATLEKRWIVRHRLEARETEVALTAKRYALAFTRFFRRGRIATSASSAHAATRETRQWLAEDDKRWRRRRTEQSTSGAVQTSAAFDPRRV